MRMLRHAPGARYELIILSDHGQTPGYPFRNRFGATLGEAVSAFLRENQQATVAAGGLGMERAQFGYLQQELDARPGGWRHRFYRASKEALQRRIKALVPETLKIDPEGGVVITYSSSLAHLYTTGEPRRLNWQEVEQAQPLLLQFLSRHKGIGFVMARGEGADGDEGVCFFHAGGRLCLRQQTIPAVEEVGFLRPYGEPVELS
jgi:hypothetical protein